jgi:hypothetical protein
LINNILNFYTKFKREEVRGRWRNSRNMERSKCKTLLFFGVIRVQIKKDDTVRTYISLKKKIYILFAKPEGRKPLGKLRT